MSILAAQCLTALLKLAFGALSLSIGRRARAGVRGAAWTLTGIALLLSGVSSVAHSGFAVWAYRAGAGTPVYETFLRWSPVGNHSRSLLAAALGGVLIVLLLRRTPPSRRFWVAAVATLLLGAGVGATLAIAEGPFLASRHYPRAALYDLAELLLLLTALLVGVARQTLDRLLWYCLGIYALRMTLNILWSGAWADASAPWRPSALAIQLIAAVAWGVMCHLALRRRRLATTEVPALFEEMGPVRVSTFG